MICARLALWCSIERKLGNLQGPTITLDTLKSEVDRRIVGICLALDPLGYRLNTVYGVIAMLSHSNIGELVE